MKRFACILFAIIVFAGFTFAQSSEINIIPKPESVKRADGVFKFDRKTKIVATDETGRKMADLLNGLLTANYGFKLEITSKQLKNNVVDISPPTLAFQHMPGFTTSSYGLRVSSDRIRIEGYEPGQFYALQSLMQLLPTDFKGSADVPGVLILDSPRFKYRGMHLDVARHFMPVSFVKKFIDLMSQYKFNYFHWHLTEDQGWRIEIKKYPKLTEIGSKRPESHQGSYSPIFKGDGIPIEGFYTQEEIKDVVAYAKARYITVIPEIELPGHASAALAAYPQFGCKAGYDYKVKMTWGIFKEVYCPTDETFKFLEDVLDETISLFPDSPYIHIGGDEVLKDHWKESAFVQDLKKRENLKDEHEVQSYFVRRIEKYLNSKGKKMIGWDEILEGGLAPNALVMSWRGMKGGIEAAKSKHDVIMTPTDYVYLDYGQGDPAYEPLSIGSYVPLEKVYSFEPVPPELTAEEAKYVIGGQANLWTEYMKTPSQVEYMAFPRMIALAEVLWSQPGNRSFAEFSSRLAAQFPRLDKQNVNYRIPEPSGLRNMIVGSSGKAVIEFRPSAATRILYTLDGSTPDHRAFVYDRPITIEVNEGETVTLKTVVVNPEGRQSAVYAATLIHREMLEPVGLTTRKPGLKYFLRLSSADPVPKSEAGETRSILLTQFAGKDLKKPFSVVFDGYFNAPADGVYEFQIDSTWDTSFLLAGETLIDGTGTKDRQVRSAIRPLKAGLHKISIGYGHRGGESHFRFRWGIKGQGLRQAYGGEFVH